MSRLYATMNTDTIKNEKTARAHHFVEGTVLYGSALESDMVMEYRVTFDKDMDRPKLILEINPNVDVQINNNRYKI